jgi:hypothetical protein
MTGKSRSRRRPGPKARAPLKERQIEGLKFFPLIRRLLEPLHAHAECPNRKLHYDEYACALMLYFLNPVLTSLRSIQQASTLRNVKKKLGIKRTSLGSLSEASHVFDPNLLCEVVRELAGRAAAQDSPKRPQGLKRDWELVAVDGSLIDALPRMAWALWLDDEHHAAKVHLEFNVLKGVPVRAEVTDGNTPERDVLRGRLTAGKLYVLDRHFMDYSLLGSILEAGSSFVCRLRENACYDVLEERELEGCARAAGVVFDRVVRCGSGKSGRRIERPLRLVKVHVRASQHPSAWRPCSAMARRKPGQYRPKDYDLLIVTDQMDLCAEDIATLYRYRWTVETFFRWFKCVLGFSHMVCESREGIQILVYCALLVSLLITLWTGRKPTKRTLEMIQLYLQGWAELDEVEQHIARLKRNED